jgi:aminomethyltransferase
VCYPLHGSDIGPDTDAISAGLGWVCALDKDFSGVDELRTIKSDGPEQRLAAFVMTEPGIPRQGMAILDGEANAGIVTSGSHSPMLDRGIGLGYVASGLAEPDRELTIDVRGKPRRARVVKKPIYSPKERNGGS